MKIKLGGVYQTRDGNRVVIVGKTWRSKYEWVGDNHLTYNKDGRQGLASNDLIGPWPEWIAWSGGECPVHPKTLVKVRYGDGPYQRDPASYVLWGTPLLYCVITEYVKPPEPMFVVTCKNHLVASSDYDDSFPNCYKWITISLPVAHRQYLKWCSKEGLHLTKERAKYLKKFVGDCKILEVVS